MPKIDKPELDEKTLEEWRAVADCVQDRIRSAKRLILVIDALRAARQDLEVETHNRDACYSSWLQATKRIAELQQRSQRDRERIAELEIQLTDTEQDMQINHETMLQFSRRCDDLMLQSQHYQERIAILENLLQRHVTLTNCDCVVCCESRAALAKEPTT